MGESRSQDSTRTQTCDPQKADALPPFNDKTLMKEMVVSIALGGEKGYTTLEKLWIRPTCEGGIGMLSGYTGVRARRQFSARAMAKVSRLGCPIFVTGQIEKLMKAHVAKVAPGAGMKVRVNHSGTAGDPGAPSSTGRSTTPHDAHFGCAAFGKDSGDHRRRGIDSRRRRFPRKTLGAPVLLVGFGLPGENAHAADEWMSDETFRLGMRAMAMLWDEYARNGTH